MNPTQLAAKYGDLLKAAAELNITSFDMQERDGKLVLKGQAPHQMEKDLFWDKIKTFSGWQQEIAAVISVKATDVYGIYTVKAGDTLSKLAERLLGDPKRYMDVFNLNKDILSDPNLIKVGQKLKLPAKAR